MVWMAILALALFLSGQFSDSSRAEIEIDYFQYREMLTEGAIGEATIIGREFHAELKAPQSIITPAGEIPNVSHIVLMLPFIDREVMDEWDKTDMEYSFKEETLDWTGYLLNMFPWLLLIGFWIFMLRRMQGGAGGVKGIFNFGKSRASLWTTEKRRVTFKDVAGDRKSVV